MAWLPHALYPVVLRLARADWAAEELARVALAWSRGPDDAGAITVRQVERTAGVYDVEVASIRPVPPIASMLFSEAIHHLRSAVDNVAFYAAELASGGELTPEQARAISMPIYDNASKFEGAMRRLTRGAGAIDAVADGTELRQRIESLQPFSDGAAVPSMKPVLAQIMTADVVNAHPLSLLRDYSNEDKHRAIRVGAATGLIQVLNSAWRESVRKGMRHVEAGDVVTRVPVGTPTALEVSAALQVQRPDGTWVAYGPELDGIAAHVCDVVIPTLIKGIALPGSIPVGIDLRDTGQSPAERIGEGTRVRAHARAQELVRVALREAEAAAIKFAPIERPDPLA